MTASRLLLAAAALLFPVTAASAAATDQRVDRGSDPRLDIRYSPDTGSYCIRARYVDPTLPSGVRWYGTTCQDRDQWARDGVIVSHRLVPAALAPVAQ